MAALALVVAACIPADAVDFGQPGPFPLTESVVTVSRADTTTFDALLFYPSSPAPTSLPVIVFAHGFLSPPELYRTTCRHLASWGYVVIASRSALEPFPSHAAYAQDLRDCLSWVIAANGDPYAPLSSRITAGAYGITGHSMGGGASLLAAAEDPRFIAVAPMAAADTRPSAVEASALITAPLLFITGSQDSFVPNPFHTRPMFDQTAAPSVWIDIKGAYHCGFLSVPLPSAVCDEGTLSRQAQLARVHPLVTAFFELNLKGDQAAWNTVWGSTSDLDRGLTVRRKTIASLSPDRTRLSVPAGGSTGLNVEVRNTSMTPRTFAIEAEGGTATVTVSPSTTPLLAPGETATISVTASLPANSRTRRDTVQIRAIDAAFPAEGGDYAWGLIRITR
jgi:dienelactone hydrolase